MASSSIAQSPTRDGRLDVLRGLCLFDMVLVHLLEQGSPVPGFLSEVIMHWLRFAAGGFVLTSGLCIGAIHFRRALDPEKRSKTYASLLKRAVFVLGVHYFASILTLILIPLHGRPVYDVGTMVRDILTFHAGYDLLLFYVFMLLASPLIIELLRGAGALAVLGASVAVFFWRYDNPYVSLWAIENHFPLIRWQLIFVVGLVLGSKLKAFDALPVRQKWQWLGVAAAVALGVDVLSAAERGGLFTLPWYLAVSKMPLSFLEVVRYVSLAVATFVLLDRAWPWLAGGRADRVLRAVGVQSLMLWVVHVPVVGNVVAWPWPLAVVGALGGVWLAAVIGSALARHWAAIRWPLPKLSYVVPSAGSAAVIAILMQLQVPRAIVETPYASIQTSGDESIFFDDDLATPIPLDVDSVTEAA